MNPEKLISQLLFDLWDLKDKITLRKIYKKGKKKMRYKRVKKEETGTSRKSQNFKLFSMKNFARQEKSQKKIREQERRIRVC